MRPAQFILSTLARVLKVPPLAVEMFTAANQASGLDTRTFPTELIPLNSIQLSRGLLNFTLLQAARNWILPYWAERQYDPFSASFVPRSHLGLSMNVTHRNWTAVGNPACSIEPIVDPRGLVTPFRNGWSIDVWLVVDDQVVFPSRTEGVEQSLVDNVPIVQTQFSCAGLRVVVTSASAGDVLFHQAEIHNGSGSEKQCTLAFAVRPFNPEGISLLHDVEYLAQECRFRINKAASLFFSHAPDFVECSSFDQGDCGTRLREGGTAGSPTSARCARGMANALAGYTLKLAQGASTSRECRISLMSGGATRPRPVRMETIRAEWNARLSRGTMLSTPDPRVNAIVRSSLATVLMLTDGSDITPGPSTYHQFWFRDAAYMLSALDKFGYASWTGPIVRAFPGKQERSGFFRSQQGEWDSNGQALWTAWHSARHGHDSSFLDRIFPSLTRGVKWIERTRLDQPHWKGTPFAGLLPAGLSAEHLGLVDYYFWDNAWSIAGIRSYIAMCTLLGREEERVLAEQLMAAYDSDLEAAITRVQTQFHLAEIPASPTRNIDCGMIGSTCFWYPLQLLAPDDPRMIATLKTLLNRFMVHGMFLQDFVHSGMNPYLTLQIAQACLYGGMRDVFWNLLGTVLSRASSTQTFPEAIHPGTGGGSMGDGHHGWAAAEVLHCLRDAFIQERFTPGIDAPELVLCAGLPGVWFTGGKVFSIRKAAVPDGTMTMRCETVGGETVVAVELERAGFCSSRSWRLELPFRASGVYLDGMVHAGFTRTGGETHISLPSRSLTVKILQDPGR